MDLCSGNPELPAILEGTEVNSEQVLCKACESLGGELLKSVWTGVELHLPLSSFHFCFLLTVTCWSWRKTAGLCVRQIRPGAGASCYEPGKAKSLMGPLSPGNLSLLGCLPVKLSFSEGTVAALCRKTDCLTFQSVTHKNPWSGLFQTLVILFLGTGSVNRKRHLGLRLSVSWIRMWVWHFPPMLDLGFLVVWQWMKAVFLKKSFYYFVSQFYLKVFRLSF